MSKFKVGDRVRATEDTWVPEGTTGTVKGHNENGHVAFESDEHTDGHGCRGVARAGHGWFIDEDELELIDRPLAVGAKVKVVDEFDRYSGHIGTVENNDNSGWLEWHVRFDDGELHYYDARHLQVITGTAAPTTPARKFKVGDRVKVVKSENGGHDVGAVGEIITVVSDPTDDLPYQVRADDDDDESWHTEDELVLVDQPTPTFKAGDRIRAIAGEDSRCYCGWKTGDEFVLATGPDGDLVFYDNDGDRRFFPAHEDKFVLADTPAAPASAPATNPLADLLAGFSATPSTGGGITFNLTINLPPGAITELLAAAKGA